MMTLELGEGEQEALQGVLPRTGDSDMLEIAAGETETRAGVMFACDSMYDCTVTLTNNLGEILAEWSSMMLPDGRASVTGSLPPAPAETDPFHRLDEGDSDSIAAIIGVASDAAAAPTATLPTPRGTYGGANNQYLRRTCNHRPVLTLAANKVSPVGMPASRKAAPSSAVRSGSSLPFTKRRISAGCASNRSARALGV